MSNVKRFNLELTPSDGMCGARLQQKPKGKYVLYKDFEILDRRFRAMIKASNQNYSEACDLQESLRRLGRLI